MQRYKKKPCANSVYSGTDYTFIIVYVVSQTVFYLILRTTMLWIAADFPSPFPSTSVYFTAVPCERLRCRLCVDFCREGVVPDTSRHRYVCTIAFLSNPLFPQSISWPRPLMPLHFCSHFLVEKYKTVMEMQREWTVDSHRAVSTWSPTLCHSQKFSVLHFVFM